MPCGLAAYGGTRPFCCAGDRGSGLSRGLFAGGCCAKLFVGEPALWYAAGEYGLGAGFCGGDMA